MSRTLAEAVTSRVEVPSRARGVGARLDVLGGALVALAAVWTLVAPRAAPGARGRVVALLALVAGSYAAARLLARVARWLPPLIVAVAVAGAFAATAPSSLYAHPLTPPLGYANANGALVAQGAFAGLLLAILGRRPALRAASVSVTLGGVGVAVLIGARAPALLVLLLAPLALLGRSERSARRVVVGLCAVFAAVLLVTVAVGATARDGHAAGVGALVEDVVTARRVALWGDAWDLMASSPARGVGVGRFAAQSPTALADADAAWAHHGFLQQGAEQGIGGFALALALPLWGFARLAASRGRDAATIVGAAALAALGIHACLDYVLHFAAVPVAAAALVGAAVARGGEHADAGDAAA
jgi:O-antigen ligase